MVYEFIGNFNSAQQQLSSENGCPWISSCLLELDSIVSLQNTDVNSRSAANQNYFEVLQLFLAFCSVLHDIYICIYKIIVHCKI